MVHDINKEIFIKKYPRSSLLDDYPKRIEQIERISISYDLFPKTKFERVKNTIYCYQDYIKQKYWSCDGHATQRLLLTFAIEYDDISSSGFVHGDINRKNILYDGEKLILCDIEPSLKQIKNDNTVFMYTHPYISESDFLNARLTTETDKIGFYFLCLRLLGHNSKFDANMITGLRNAYRHNRFENWCSILPFPEAELQTMSFQDISILANGTAENKVLSRERHLCKN